MIDRLATDLPREPGERRGWSRSNLFFDAGPGRGLARPANRPTALDDCPGAGSPFCPGWMTRTPASGTRTRLLRVVGPGRSLRTTSPRTCDRVPGTAANSPQVHLDPDDADQARKILKEPYVVDSVGLDKHASEGELGDALIARLQGTLREFGCAFVGRQVEVDGDEFFIDCSDSRSITIVA